VLSRAIYRHFASQEDLLLTAIEAAPTPGFAGLNDLSRPLRSRLAAADEEQPLPGTTPLEVWAIGHALLPGLLIDQCIAPDVITPEVFGRACELLAGLYPPD
jgi:AcrR family transcriptional regulator